MTNQNQWKDPEDFLNQNPKYSLSQFNEASYRIDGMGEGMRLVRGKNEDGEYFWHIYKIAGY
jgi:hypothetical protein